MIEAHFAGSGAASIPVSVRWEARDSVAGLSVTGIDKTDGYKFSLEDGGWLLVRFSGTELLIRVYCETTHEDKVQGLLDAGLEIAGIG